MKAMTKPELEQSVATSITHTLELLEEVYISYHLCTIEEMRKERLPFGDNLRVLDFICMVFNILIPLMPLARNQWPEADHIMEWAEDIAKKMMVSTNEEE